MEDIFESGLSHQEKTKMILSIISRYPGIRHKDLVSTLVVDEIGVKGPFSRSTFDRTLRDVKKGNKVRIVKEHRESRYYPNWYPIDPQSLCYRKGSSSGTEEFILDQCKTMLSEGLTIQSHRVRHLLPTGVRYQNTPISTIRSDYEWELREFEFRCQALFRLIVWMEQVRDFKIPRGWTASDYSVLFEIYDDELYEQNRRSRQQDIDETMKKDNTLPILKDEVDIPSFESWITFLFTSIEYISIYIQKKKVTERIE